MLTPVPRAFYFTLLPLGGFLAKKDARVINAPIHHVQVAVPKPMRSRTNDKETKRNGSCSDFFLKKRPTTLACATSNPLSGCRGVAQISHDKCECRYQICNGCVLTIRRNSREKYDTLSTCEGIG